MQKKRITAWLTCFLLAFVYSILAFSYSLHRAESIYVGKNFYFLVSMSKCTEVGIFDVQSEGGAGYLFSYDGKEYVALSVYLNVVDADIVQSTLRAEGEKTELKQASVERLYFSAGSEKARKNAYVAALDCLYQHITVLEGEIARLSKGGTQESSKRILRILSKQFSYLAKIYDKTYENFSRYCKTAAGDIDREIEQTVYVSRLRYILCDMCVNYLNFSKGFEL